MVGLFWLRGIWMMRWRQIAFLQLPVKVTPCNDVMWVNGKNRRIALKPVNYRRKFNSWLNPSGFKVFSFKIQKSSRLSRVFVASWGVMWLVFSTFSINVIFACFSKLCPLVEECWSTVMESSFLESDRWLLVRRLDAVSLLPM